MTQSRKPRKAAKAAVGKQVADPSDGRYVRAIEKAFVASYSPGIEAVDVTQAAIVRAAKSLSLDDIANIPEMSSTRFDMGGRPCRRASRYSHQRARFGPSTRSVGAARRTRADTGLRQKRCKAAAITPNPHAVQIKVPDSTPGIIARYALKGEREPPRQAPVQSDWSTSSRA